MGRAYSSYSNFNISKLNELLQTLDELEFQFQNQQNSPMLPAFNPDFDDRHVQSPPESEWCQSHDFAENDTEHYAQGLL